MGILELSIWYLSPIPESDNVDLSADASKATTTKATIVCATQNCDGSILAALSTWCLEKPYEIIIVATPGSFPWVQENVSQMQSQVPIRILESTATHKRRQLCMGFKITSTDVVIICDDDTKWTKNVLLNLVRPLLEQSRLGCVFPDLRIDPVRTHMTIWELLGLLRHAGDGVDFQSSLRVDGGVFCHHGSTAAYRGQILRDPAFIKAFEDESWRGHNLNSGDDQFLCRWLTNQGWSVALRSAKSCLVQTRSRPSWRHMLQLLRWSRNDWRASLSTLIWERVIWR